MTLLEYLKQARGLAAQIAAQIGTSPTYLWHLASGRKKRPDVALCIAIERATGGAVRCEELRPGVDWQYLRTSRQQDESINQDNGG
ncbi:transcriptional regulator [Chitiniphilus purpureus]|uniref:transcriptional regulator n=1 Tax=Chitiniphilus purpureus TaxID=2981137 RepID=UPI0027E3E502|nr:YdaS family helix-turn-helix protein [Chitiniphilus sp. CD1]